MSDGVLSFRNVLKAIADQSTLAWVHLPREDHWSLDSRCLVLESDEVPLENENDPEAGLPELARSNGLIEALLVVTVQDIVSNALAQRPNATIDELFDAFMFYYDRDAFIDFEHPDVDV